ncbi:hypothetical protein [Chromobacterium violaceum]|uniref:hypothetical protein n=1 Tax=Chromobacterium violaceum TaxID=536 RepID=UPI003F5D8937
MILVVVEFEQHGIAFESLNEKIATGSAESKLIAQVFVALAQFDRNRIMCTRSGLTTGRGRSDGRQLKLADKQEQEIMALFRASDIHVFDVAHYYGVSRTTHYQYIGVIASSS